MKVVSLFAGIGKIRFAFANNIFYFCIMGRNKDKKYEIAYNDYLAGFSLEQIANKIGVTRQCVFKAFKKRGLELRNRMFITPKGYEAISKSLELSTSLIERKFRNYQIFDNQKFSLRNNGYYALTNGNRKLMHRYVWEKIKGKIPNGYDIHHINEDKTDNRIENLECLPKAEHTRKYSPHNNQYTKGRKIERN